MVLADSNGDGEDYLIDLRFLTMICLCAVLVINDSVFIIISCIYFRSGTKGAHKECGGTNNEGKRKMYRRGCVHASSQPANQPAS
jgi:hypothetical protein